MKKRVFIILSVVAATVLTFVIGAIAGRGILSTWSHKIQPAYAAQDTEPDPEAGLIVTRVDEDGPTDKAGVVRGDILLSIDGNEVNSMVDVRDILDDLEAGDHVQLSVLHGDQVQSLDVTLEEGALGGKLGLTLCCGRPIHIEIESFTLEDVKPLIIQVQKGSPAEEAGLQPGDLILSIDGQEIDEEEGLSDLLSKYKPGHQIELEIRRLREQETRSITVELGEHPEVEGRAYLGVQVSSLPGFHICPREGGIPEEFPFFIPPMDDEAFPFHHFFKDEWILPFTESGFEGGILIVEVIEDTPSSQSDLQEGDVITTMDDESIENPESFADTIRSMKPGEEITLFIFRPSTEETLEIKVTLGGHPEDPDMGYLGIKIKGIIRIKHLDEHDPLQHWFPFLDRFHLPFQFEHKFQIPRTKGA